MKLVSNLEKKRRLPSHPKGYSADAGLSISLNQSERSSGELLRTLRQRQGRE